MQRRHRLLVRQASAKSVDGHSDISIDYGVILADGRILGVNKFAAGMVFFFDTDGPGGFNRSGHDIFNFFLVNANTVGTHEGCQYTLNILKSGIYPGSFGNCFVPHSSYSREELLGTTIHRPCNPSRSSDGKQGDACAALIMQDGWEMKKDYPVW